MSFSGSEHNLARRLSGWISFSQRLMTMVATPLPMRFVRARHSLMKRSMPTSKASDTASRGGDRTQQLYTGRGAEHSFLGGAYVTLRPVSRGGGASAAVSAAAAFGRALLLHAACEGVSRVDSSRVRSRAGVLTRGVAAGTLADALDDS